MIGADLHDTSFELTRWLRDKGAAAVLVRPDGFIYTATGSADTLAPPPAGLTGPEAPTVVTELRNGAPA